MIGVLGLIWEAEKPPVGARRGGHGGDWTHVEPVLAAFGWGSGGFFVVE